MPAPTGTRITIRKPDDFHHHCRDGHKTAAILSHATRRFSRCLMMPNLVPPVTTTEMALEYKKHILASMPPSETTNTSKNTFTPLMTLYLTDHTTPQEINTAVDAGIVACKYYPAGATTNSKAGVTNVANCYPAIQAMSDRGMMLCIHSEVTHADIFEREPVFIAEVMTPLVAKFPDLSITMEHISTKEAVDYILSQPPSSKVKATITCHHLLYNRNHLLVGGIRPHLYCLPILKGENHRLALVEAAVSGNPRFFLGTDSAPHPITGKETACGCAGVYTAHAAVELYAETFDQQDALDKLEDFCSSFGADHYGLERNAAQNTITLEKTAWQPPMEYDFGGGTVLRPLRAGEDIAWRIVDDKE